MNILNLRHPDISENQETALVAQANAGASTLSVINTKGIAVSNLLLVGAPGSENAEIVKTHGSTPPTDVLITLLAALKFSHSTDTPIVLLDWDQIEVSRATSQGGSYSVLETIAITPDQESTPYRDSGGSSTDYYKIRFKNSISGAFSGYSAEIPAGGFDDTALAGLVDSVYRLFSKHSRKLLDRADVVKWLNEGYHTLVRKICDLGIDYNVYYGTDNAGAVVAFVANQRAFTLPTNFIRGIRWEFSYDGITYRPADPIDSTFHHSEAVYSQTSPRYYYEGKKIVPLPKPTASTGGMRPRYVALPAKMTDDDDTPELPLGYEQSPVNFALKKACESDKKFEEANYHGTLFDNDVETMLAEIQNRYPERPKSVPMFGEDLEGEVDDGFIRPGT